MPKEGRIVISVEVSKEYHEKVKTISHIHRVPQKVFFDAALGQFLERYEKNHGKIESIDIDLAEIIGV